MQHISFDYYNNRLYSSQREQYGRIVIAAFVLLMLCATLNGEVEWFETTSFRSRVFSHNDDDEV